MKRSNAFSVPDSTIHQAAKAVADAPGFGVAAPGFPMTA